MAEPARSRPARSSHALARLPVVAILAAVALSILFGATGCRTPRDFTSPRGGDPQARLGALLEAWHARQADGRSCEQDRPSETPLVDCERIRKQIERLTVEFPSHPEVLLANAVVAFEAGRREEAEKDLDVLRRLDPVHPEAALLRARLAIADGNLRLARRMLDEQIGLTPDHAGLHELSSSVFYLEERWSDAAYELELASRLGAPAWRVAYHQGLIFESTGRLEEAANAYRVCLDAEPDFQPAQSRLRALAVGAGMSR